MNYNYSKLLVKEDSRVVFSNFPTLEDGGYNKKTAKEEQAADNAEDRDKLIQCLLAGFPNNVAVLDTDNRYRIVGNRQEIAVHPSSALHGRTNQSVPRKANKPAAIRKGSSVQASPSRMPSEKDLASRGPPKNTPQYVIVDMPVYSAPR